MKIFNFCIILTCTINPIEMPDLVRNNPKIRLQDYKKSFNFWINNNFVDKIILIENSNFDLSYFREIAKKIKNKEIEIHGDGLQTRTFTFIEDTVDGFFRAVTMREAVNDIFNVASEPDEEITIIGLANFIWKMVNGTDKAKVKFIPYATFGNYEDVRRRVPDITKIKAKLGFSPSYNLESGMRKTIEWQKNLMNY